MKKCNFIRDICIVAVSIIASLFIRAFIPADCSYRNAIFCIVSLIIMSLLDIEFVLMEIRDLLKEKTLVISVEERSKADA